MMFGACGKDAVGRSPFRPWLSTLVFATFALTGCKHLGSKPIELEVDAQSHGGKQLAVAEIPKDWTPLAPSPSRVEFIAPDRVSQVYLRAMPTMASEVQCPQLVKQYTDDLIEVWSLGAKLRPEKTEAPDGVIVELRQKNKTKSHVVWGRVMCRNGVMAVLSCSTLIAKEVELKKTCDSVVQSLTVKTQPPEKTANAY
jgi:hypothetical protein